MDTWSRQSQLTLVAIPNASYWARRHTEDLLREWGAETLSSDAQLVVTELVTNAMKESGGLDAYAQNVYIQEPRAIPYERLAELATIRLRLSYGSRRLLIEVWDESEPLPEVKTPDLDSQNGRVLIIVGALSDKFGWYPAEGGGKVVWAEMAEAAVQEELEPNTGASR